MREFEAFADGFTPIHWVLVILGSLFFALIITVLILQAVWLVREIRSNQRQQNFMDAVTHELHTPLASLRLYLDTLRGRALPEERRDEFLEIMAEDLERLQRTIDQILPRRAHRRAARAARADRRRAAARRVRRRRARAPRPARRRRSLVDGARAARACAATPSSCASRSAT